MTVSAQAARGWEPWVVNTANGLGWSEPGFVIVALTVGVFLVYIAAFFLMYQIAWWAKEKFIHSSGFVAFLWWWVAVAFLLVTMVLHIIHTLLFVWFGYSAAEKFRDWWQEPVVRRGRRHSNPWA